MLEAEVARKRPSPGAVYNGPEQLVLEAGRRWRWRRLSRDFSPGVTRWGIPRGCFSNSMIAAIQHPDLRYVEGFAYAGHFPIHHAWNVDADDTVIDFTWREDRELAPRRGRAYHGVVVPIERAWESTWHQSGSVLDLAPDFPELFVTWPRNDHPDRPSLDRLAELVEDVGARGRDLARKLRLESKENTCP